MTQAINSYNVLIDRFQAFATGHYMINAFTHGILPAIDETKDKQYPWMHVLCSGIVQQAGQAEYSWTVYFFDLPRDKADAHENKREALSDCIRLAQDLIYEVDNGNVLFGNTVDLLTGAQIVPGIDEWTNTLTGVELTFTMAVPDDYDACAIPADFSVGSGTDTSTPGVSSLSFSESLNNTDGVVTLDNDEESPGNTKYYGTNSSGVKGWYTIPGGGGGGVDSVSGESVDNADPDNPIVNAWPLAGTGTDLANGTIEVEPAFAGTLIEQDDGSGGSQYVGFYGNTAALEWFGASGQSADCRVQNIGLAQIGAADGLGNDGNFRVQINPYSDSATYPIVNIINSLRHQFYGSSAPTVNDDVGIGYGVNSFWIYNGRFFICTDVSTGAAVWNEIGSAGGTWGAITGTLSSQTDLQTALDAKDVLPVVVSSNQTAANDGRYINVASATYTDPTPAEGKGFVVFVRNGTATVGGTAYAIAGTVIHRVYHSGAWTNYKYQEIGALTANRSLLLDSNKDLKSDGVGETRVAYNSTTQAVTSASETDITALVLSVAANKKYLVEIAIATECSGTSGIQFGHKFPSGSTFKLTHSGRTSGPTALMNLGYIYTSNTGLIPNSVNTSASATGSYVASCLLVTTNAGNYQLTFASVSGAQTSTIREYAHIKLTEIP